MMIGAAASPQPARRRGRTLTTLRRRRLADLRGLVLGMEAKVAGGPGNPTDIAPAAPCGGFPGSRVPEEHPRGWSAEGRGIRAPVVPVRRVGVPAPAVGSGPVELVVRAVVHFRLIAVQPTVEGDRARRKVARVSGTGLPELRVVRAATAGMVLPLELRRELGPTVGDRMGSKAGRAMGRLAIPLEGSTAAQPVAIRAAQLGRGTVDTAAQLRPNALIDRVAIRVVLVAGVIRVGRQVIRVAATAVVGAAGPVAIRVVLVVVVMRAGRWVIRVVPTVVVGMADRAGLVAVVMRVGRRVIRVTPAGVVELGIRAVPAERVETHGQAGTRVAAAPGSVTAVRVEPTMEGELVDTPAGLRGHARAEAGIKTCREAAGVEMLDRRSASLTRAIRRTGRIEPPLIAAPRAVSRARPVSRRGPT